MLLRFFFQHRGTGGTEGHRVSKGENDNLTRSVTFAEKCVKRVDKVSIHV